MPPSRKFLPYGRQFIDDDDVASVVDVLRSDWLTCGPKVEEFERAFAAKLGVEYAVAVNSGTAALHAAACAAGIGPDDEVIVPPITFVATANCVAFLGARPIFCDVEQSTLLLDPQKVAGCLSPRTKAIIAVDYAGHPCDYDALHELARQHNIMVMADACHALGATYRGRPVGTLTALNTFSFHPVKHITTAEGGMITTSDRVLYQRMMEFRNHGITRRTDAFEMTMADTMTASADAMWYYEMQALGYNYRLSDLNCALGLAQLRKLDRFVARRREIADRYTERLVDCPLVTLPSVHPWAESAWHLYPIRIDFTRLRRSRAEIMNKLRGMGIGTQVHYIPVYLHPYYRRRWGYKNGLCPIAEKAYEQLLSLPIFYSMTDDDVDYVVDCLRKVLAS